MLVGCSLPRGDVRAHDRWYFLTFPASYVVSIIAYLCRLLKYVFYYYCMYYFVYIFYTACIFYFMRFQTTRAKQSSLIATVSSNSAAVPVRLFYFISCICVFAYAYISSFSFSVFACFRIHSSAITTYLQPYSIPPWRCSPTCALLI